MTPAASLAALIRHQLLLFELRSRQHAVPVLATVPLLVLAIVCLSVARVLATDCLCLRIGSRNFREPGRKLRIQ
tara:strand:- start:2093 stop:2314 length:222 start_codon:yes stop_codon:yes gene_type:complete